jgi:hypothetical protein
MKRDELIAGVKGQVVRIEVFGGTRKTVRVWCKHGPKQYTTHMGIAHTVPDALLLALEKAQR